MRIHLITGEKGGVGKSQVALAFIAFYTTQNRPLVICEADRSNGDVGRATDGKDGHTIIYPHFTENTDHIDKADSMLDAVLTQHSDAIVNCPAQAHRAIVQWISQGSADLAIEEGIQFCFWFVTSGEYDSVALFLQSLKEFPTIPHVLVRNAFFTDRLTYDYSGPLRSKDLKKAIDGHRVPVIELPRFMPSDLDFIKAHALSFTEAIQNKGLTIAARSRVKRALDHFFTQLTPLEVLTNEPTAHTREGTLDTNDSTPGESGAETTGKSTRGKKRSRKSASVESACPL
ncbi:MAG: hypothetical protein F6J97_24510 [Leptolyngbya sp. SIO4C1]|nr:hypothetical protein [Leptolyngbya sp. SIO4C1]